MRLTWRIYCQVPVVCDAATQYRYQRQISIYSDAAAVASIRKSLERERDSSAPPKPARHMTPVHLVLCLVFFFSEPQQAPGCDSLVTNRFIARSVSRV